MIDGTKLTLRGQEYTIPPLTLDAFEKVAETIEGLRAKSMREVMVMAPAIVLPAMRPNYPELTEQKLKAEVLDVSNVLDVLGAVLGATFAGMPKAAPGEAKAP